ncbi:MAG: hypothetical protein L3V56_01980 [Candidatus Magnetoovum sp. WYHC-5]|nr:hypothetical protein [Candidatus Magnetoovum sp. WYHC-5]
MNTTIIDAIYKDYKEMDDFFIKNNELNIAVRKYFSKLLLLSAASFFEKTLTEHILQIVRIHTGGRKIISEFVKNKAITRQYHTYFNWNEKNANSFFGLFGRDFKNFMVDIIKSDSNMDESIKSFLELGQLRNRLVHENFAEFNLEKTVEEVYSLYQSALSFVNIFPEKLHDYTTNSF